MIELLAISHQLAVIGLSLYGFLGIITLWLYRRHREDAFPLPKVGADELPRVTVQLPVFNERYVVDRLITAAALLEYPKDRLQIQVIDDSTDDTTLRAAERVAYFRDRGINISLLHRPDREGFKAGALSNALGHAEGEYLAIFDADFQPPPRFLQLTIPYFTRDPRLGMIQARWDHLNERDSPLTAAQAIALDKHFAVEQTVRHRANLFPKFNGAAGIWRQECLRDAGGWQDDTVCEDLCLSTRAILKGWKFLFLKDVTAPAELPTSIAAYKNQQARWAKGSIQCLRKYGLAILADSNHSLPARLYALLSMSAYATHVLMLILLLVQVPLVVLDHQPASGMLWLSLAGIGQPLLFVLAQQALHPNWRRRLRHLPTLLLVAVGTAPSNSRAMAQALFNRRHPFTRTPKGVCSGLRESQTYQLPFDSIVLFELAFVIYAGLGLALAIGQGNWGPVFFLATCVLGLGYVAWLSILEAVSN